MEVALNKVDLSARELAHYITDEQHIFISESSVYQILKQRELITVPSHILICASDEFKDKTSFVHQMWQTDFTYFKIMGWGYYYLSSVLDDYGRYIIHWELFWSSMKTDDVKRTIDQAVNKAKKTDRTKILEPRQAYSSQIRGSLPKFVSCKLLLHFYNRSNFPAFYFQTLFGHRRGDVKRINPASCICIDTNVYGFSICTYSIIIIRG